MITNAHRLRSIGWLVLLALFAAAVMVLAFRVNALRSQVHRTEAKIVALRLEQLYLQTEFETRANQQQLRDWNALEFGYVAPSAGQYLENERQLAQLARPDTPGAPEPIRVASIDDAVTADAAFPAFVSPLTGKPLADETPARAVGARIADAKTADANSADANSADEGQEEPADHDAATAALGAKLAKVPTSHQKDDAVASKTSKTGVKPAHASAATAKPKRLAEAKPAVVKLARAKAEARSRK